MSMNKTARTLFLNKLAVPDTITVIFQLTDQCVLSCKYCFAKGSYPRYDNENLMSTEIVNKAIMQSFSTRHKEIIFEWTGGESFLAGINFYKYVIERQKIYANKTFHNVIQTSGYLYNEKLIDFLVENHFLISTTIDGTKDVHDFNRPTNRNKSSLEQILKTRNYIIKKQGDCGFISTVTKINIGKEANILRYFRSLGTSSFHSNPYIYYSKNHVKNKNIALTNEDYASYLINQFNAWIEQGKKTPVPRTIDYIFHKIYSKIEYANTLCTFGGKCITNFISITPNGATYTCPKFIGIKPMELGNIKNSTIADILSEINPKMSKLIDERISALNKCEKENCRYLYLCNGGCPYYSLISSDGRNIKEKDCLCGGKKMVYQYLESVVDTLSNSNRQFG